MGCIPNRDKDNNEEPGGKIPKALDKTDKKEKKINVREIDPLKDTQEDLNSGSVNSTNVEKCKNEEMVKVVEMEETIKEKQESNVEQKEELPEGKNPQKIESEIVEEMKIVEVVKEEEVNNKNEEIVKNNDQIVANKNKLLVEQKEDVVEQVEEIVEQTEEIIVNEQEITENYPDESQPNKQIVEQTEEIIKKGEDDYEFVNIKSEKEVFEESNRKPKATGLIKKSEQIRNTEPIKENIESEIKKTTFSKLESKEEPFILHIKENDITMGIVGMYTNKDGVGKELGFNNIVFGEKGQIAGEGPGGFLKGNFSNEGKVKIEIMGGDSKMILNGCFKYNLLYGTWASAKDSGKFEITLMGSVYTSEEKDVIYIINISEKIQGIGRSKFGWYMINGTDMGITCFSADGEIWEMEPSEASLGIFAGTLAGPEDETENIVVTPI